MLGAIFNWSSSRDSSTSHESQDRKKLKKKGVRTRAEQLASLDGDAHRDEYYPGLVNMSGTYCFMNSVVQVCIGLPICRRSVLNFCCRLLLHSHTYNPR